jgi:muramoyltetrapeptide carboxypeptidase
VNLKRIRPDSAIGVLAPAFFPDETKMKNGLEYLKNRGFRIIQGESLHLKHGYFAGPDAVRINEILGMFADPAIDAIICARGGWGALRLLQQLDYDLIRRHPKLFVGYSDITTLQLAFWAKAGLPSLSGPMVAVEMGNGIQPFTADHFWGQVFNEKPYYTFSLNDPVITVWKHGRARGTLLGGCLSMLAHQLGTSYSPDYSGSILYIEDIGEEPYKIDRYLAHLKAAGVFDKISALIIGNFIDCTDADEKRNSFTVEEVLLDYFMNTPFPVIYNFPYGHGDIKVTMPIGVPAEIDTETGEIRWGNPWMSGEENR